MRHTQFRQNWPTDSGAEDFLSVLPYATWKPSWSCDQHHIDDIVQACIQNLVKKWPSGF